jgi:hypothetical protein
MLKGINLTLMIGPAVPIPAPKVVVDSLTSVQVNNGGDRGGFQLTFSVSKTSPLLTTMLPVGYFDPMKTRVIIVVTVKGFPNVIMDGIVTRQELAPSSEPGQSTLTITGEDLSVLMDVVDVVRPFPAMDDAAIMYMVLAPYAMFGVVPVVVPSLFTEFPPVTERFEMQRSTDLNKIRELTSRNGYVFFIEPGPLPGQSIGYFGPNIRIPIPQPALSVNMDAHTNVESLSFSLNGLAKELTIVTIFDPFTDKIPISVPIPNVDIFQPPLGLRPTPPAKIKFADDVSGKSIIQVLKETVGRLMVGNANAITGSGSLDVLRYGRVLRARMLVGVRGAGLAYDGLYYVDSVTHSIKRGEYKQNFSLSRDGLISNTPILPT